MASLFARRIILPTDLLKTLYVLRHAKSSWDDPTLGDPDRPLAPRGIRAAAALASHIQKRRIRPDVVLSSTARRARETLDGIAGALGADARVIMEDELYGAPAATLVARLCRLDSSVTSALVIGHNPGLQALVVTLCGDGDDAALASVRRKFATASLATLLLPGRSWKRLAPGVAYLEGCFVPRGRH